MGGGRGVRYFPELSHTHTKAIPNDWCGQREFCYD